MPSKQFDALVIGSGAAGSFAGSISGFGADDSIDATTLGSGTKFAFTENSNGTTGVLKLTNGSSVAKAVQSVRDGRFAARMRCCMSCMRSRNVLISCSRLSICVQLARNMLLRSRGPGRMASDGSS